MGIKTFEEFVDSITRTRIIYTSSYQHKYYSIIAGSTDPISAALYSHCIRRKKLHLPSRSFWAWVVYCITQYCSQNDIEPRGMLEGSVYLDLYGDLILILTLEDDQLDILKSRMSDAC